MIIGQMISPVHSLGPGERICLWTKGCNKHCEGCISPELQSMDGVQTNENDLAELLCQLAVKNKCTGLTISGGDPFEQAEALLRLLQLVRNQFDDILVYTGYEYRELVAGLTGNAGIRCLDYIDVLIDGRYVKALNKPDCVLRGSENQTILYLNEEKRPAYEKYMKQGRIIETFTHGNSTIITGILDEV